MATANDEIIQAAIEGLEAKKQRIDEVIAQIRERMNGGSSASTPASSAAKNGRRTMSAEARKRIAEAQRKRWAAKRASEPTAAPAAKPSKRHISPEGKRRIIAATKKRWAAYRAAQRAGK